MARTVTPATAIALAVLIGGALLVTLTVALLMTVARSGTPQLAIFALASLLAVGGLARSAPTTDGKAR
ncbi:hypothetical protein HUG10_07810 [Halorarum halophilum]|uniref:Uncharacterized protein n=1 Tax=Halorarum halophilum TaxID=2743090 RepID=A0A7D5K141_9EURY|nr:hypothetical protein [Halobaculum halophilum]QLG27461.1 hypothetical protein HUG10_07810 [Halobaculum halophilum]